MLLVAVVLSFIESTIWPAIFAYSMHHIVFPLAFIESAICPTKQPFTLHNILEPFTFIIAFIFPSKLAVTSLFSCYKCSFIFLTARPLVCSLPIWQPLNPVTYISLAILFQQSALAMILIMQKIALVKLSVGLVHFSHTMSFPLKPGSLISWSIGPFLYSIPMFELVLPLALILDIPLKLDLPLFFFNRFFYWEILSYFHNLLN